MKLDQQVIHLPASRQNACDGRAPWLVRGRVPCLDGLRAFSIILVLLHHASGSIGFPFSRSFFQDLEVGKMGVNCFFGISGFLITLLLLRESKAAGTISLRAFYSRRALRILPAYVVFLSAVFVLQRLQITHLASRDWFGVLTYTANLIDHKNSAIAHIWSLSLEEQFYLLWPPLLVWLGVSRSKGVLLSYLVIAPAARVAFRIFLPAQGALAYTSPAAMECIVVGCLLALYATEPSRGQSWLFEVLKRPFIGYGAPILLFFSFALADWSSVYGLLLHNLVAALSVAAMIWFSANLSIGWIGRILSSKPMVWLGVLSYSIYLWQQLFLIHPARFVWPANVAVAIMAGTTSYLLVERPFLRWKDRLVRKTGMPKNVIPLNSQPAVPTGTKSV